jgi:hypothetical protein
MLKCDGIVWLKGSGSSQYACWTQPRLSIGYLLQEWKNVQKFSKMRNNSGVDQVVTCKLQLWNVQCHHQP